MAPIASVIIVAWVFTIPVTFFVSFGLSAGIEAWGLWPVLGVAIGAVVAANLLFRARSLPVAAGPSVLGDHAAD